MIKIYVVCLYWASYEGQGISNLIQAFTDKDEADLFAQEQALKYQNDEEHSIVTEEVDLK